MYCGLLGLSALALLSKDKGDFCIAVFAHVFVGEYVDVPPPPPPPKKKKNRCQIYPLINFVDKAFVLAGTPDFNV